MSITPRTVMGQDVDVYSLRAGSLAGSVPELQFQMRRHAVQATLPAGPVFASRWSTADRSPMSVGTPAVGFQRSRRPRSAWLADALRALAEVDDEIAEDGLPEITSVPHFQDHASDNWEPEGAGGDGVVNRSWSGRRSNMLSCSTCSIW